MGKRLPQLYYIKIKISYDLGFIVLNWSSHGNVTTLLRFLIIFVFLCTRSFFKKSLKGVCTCHNCLNFYYGKVWKKFYESISEIFWNEVLLIIKTVIRNSMLSRQLAIFLRKWYALETRFHLIVVWFHWKLRTKKEGNCSGRSRVRRILLTNTELTNKKNFINSLRLFVLFFLICKVRCSTGTRNCNITATCRMRESIFSRVIYYGPNRDAGDNPCEIPLDCIHPNPGPVKNPCVLCERAIARNHKFICCGDCWLKFHIKCAGITVKKYLLMVSGNKSWTCQPCYLKFM